MISVRLVFLALLGCIATPLSAQPRFADPNQDVGRVIELIDRRLALMPEVAASKWRAQQPIVDAARERAVLDRSVADAEAMGLDAASARQFFDVQIRMARAVQVQCFERWRAGGESTVPAGRDLNSELRPLLDAIGNDLLTTVYLASADWSRAALDTRLAILKRHAGVTDALLSELHAALGSLRISAAPMLAAIKRAGVLRVGTTGDYAPFSAERDGELSGFDVRLAAALARHLGVEARFVRTSWPTLMQDFNAHRFDIAMSGISITPERDAQADFSTAYHVDGKTPIARCDDVRRFATLEQIDQPNVRIVVNPGGANERFVREHIKRASLIVHADNRTVFDELLAGRADVMITDGIEVQLQTHRHPELCGTMRTPLTQSGKAIMLPRVSELTQQVNAWLAPQIGSGELKRQLQRAVTEAR